MKQLCPETSHLPTPGLRSKALDDSWFIRAATRLFVERDLNSRSVSRTTVNDRHESFSVACSDRSRAWEPEQERAGCDGRGEGDSRPGAAQ